MSWTIEELQRDWLLGSHIAFEPKVVVGAFNVIERLLGREWIETSRVQQGSVIRGASPTLHVVLVGRGLACIEGIVGADRLIQRLGNGDRSAQAELMAVYLLSSHGAFTVELYPRFTDTTGGEHESDFRIRHQEEPWTYVEVAQPNFSQLQLEAQDILNTLTSSLNEVNEVRERFALEVFLRREPTSNELDSLVERIRDFCLSKGKKQEDLGDLGMLLLNQTEPGQIVPSNHPGEENLPRLSMAQARFQGNETLWHVNVRMPYADQRAEAFLTSEARQLPQDSPGLLMFDIAGEPSAISSWVPLLRRRFQPTQHTRVSAICLFLPSTVPTNEGMAWAPTIRLLTNPHARLSFPPSAKEALEQAREETRTKYARP